MTLIVLGCTNVCPGLLSNLCVRSVNNSCRTGGPGFLPFQWLSGELFSMSGTDEADRRELFSERPSLVYWPGDVDRYRLEAMEWYNNHPAYALPTSLPLFVVIIRRITWCSRIITRSVIRHIGTSVSCEITKTRIAV